MNPVATLRQWSASDGRHGTKLFLWCPGCDTVDPGHAGLHAVNVGDSPAPRWEWDGNLEQPTLNPSIMVAGPPLDDLDILCQRGVCHSFVKAGQWQFLGDCTHPLAGQTVPLPPLPDWILS